MSARDWLDNARCRGVLDALDVMLAQSLVEKAGEGNEQLLWLVALLSYQHRQGHVCIDLQRPPAMAFDQPDCPWQVPSHEQLHNLSSPLLGRPGENCPLILDGPRLYLRRHWSAEQSVALALRERCVPQQHDAAALKQITESIFSERADLWQRAAAVNCARHRFGVITGGPGTGKTWTVTRMLALQCLLAQHAERPLPRIAMAAPTGKAAARLTEALQAALPDLPVADSIKAVLPEEAVTLHRLLAMDMHGAPRHHRERPLPYDLVVVDEASMIDLGLMAQLTAALPDEASLYLVGDRDQLASVQAGSVFADVCGDAENQFDADTAACLQQVGIDVPVNAQALPIDSAVVRLQKVHRFAGDSAIAVMANAVRSHDIEALANLRNTPHDDLGWLPSSSDAILETMCEHYQPLVQAAIDGADAEFLLASFARFRVLAATRRGPLGVEQLNERLEHNLHQQFGLGTAHWYPGKTVMLKHNDWNLRLFNGDIGICVKDPAGDQLSVAFPAADGGVRLVAPARLPDCEPAWAMTIHKSQGSEFHRVLLVLPGDDSPVLTRELLYTGITRAREQLMLAANPGQLAACMARPVYRASGLHQRLRD